jgi:adhesin transport system membrane fusion protein
MVKPDLPALVKLDSYDYAVFGALHATVRYVSPDAISQQTVHGDMPFYRVRVAISKEPRHGRASEIVLRPGMSATVDIRSGSRTVLEYLTKPISRMMDESLKEK